VGTVSDLAVVVPFGFLSPSRDCRNHNDAFYFEEYFAAWRGLRQYQLNCIPYILQVQQLPVATAL
jgi:hypothetical protein